jgi:hypothetical protein
VRPATSITADVNHRRLFLIGLVALFGRPGDGRADDAVPVARQATMLVRAIAYDGNLAKRAAGEVTIAVLRKNGDAPDATVADEMERAFADLGSIKIAGLPVRVLGLVYGGPEALAKTVADQGIDTLYVCPALQREVAGIRTVTREHAVLTLASRPEQLKAGLSLGVFPVDGKSVIMVNVGATREEGAAFGSDLLRLARLVK